MACNYSNKFLPLVLNLASGFEGTKEVFEAQLAELFTNPETAIADLEGKITFASEQKEQRETNSRAPIRLNTKQATIGVQEGSSISSAFLGRSDAYSEMIKNFRRKMLELSRLKIDFESGSVDSFNSNEIELNGISRLGMSILDYKLSLVEKICQANDDVDAFNQVKSLITNAIQESDLTTADEYLNTLVNMIKSFPSISDSVYNEFVILSNFDKLLKQECPYIEIDERYGDSESISKYKYVGANVVHFSGWTSSEFADSMDQASMLVKSVLDYIPECNKHGLPIQGSSIGLTGFYSVMSAMRNTLLYHPDKVLLQERKKLLRGTKVDMADLIQKYIEYLERENSSVDSVSSFYETHRTYLIGKLKGIQKFIFDENVNLDKELRDIFNNMFFKNVQMSYVAYTYDPIKNDFTGTDLKASVINAQTYALSGSVASAIYQYKVNGKGPNHKYEIITDNRRFGEIKIRYAGKEFGFKQASKESSGIITDFEFAEFKDLFFDLFGYLLPDNYVEIGRQINGDNWNYKEELGEILRIGFKGFCEFGDIEYENKFPTNLESKWYKEFAKIGKVVSTIYGADTINVVKNVSRKNNLPLFGLNSLAYNFPFIMWNHMDDNSENNIYQDSFLFDIVDSEGNVIQKSIVGEPKVRSEILYNGKLKSASKLTVAEVSKMSILNDFFQNFLEGKHIYLQNATFADKGTHFLVNYDLKTPIYGNQTLKDLIEDQIKNHTNPNSTGLFSLMYQTRNARITKLVDNIIDDYNKVFRSTQPDVLKFKSLKDIEKFVKNYKHDTIRKAFVDAGVNFYEEIHLSKGKINETIKSYYEICSDPDKLEKRLNEERAKFARDLKNNRVKFNINQDAISKKIGSTYKDWVKPDGSIIISKEGPNKTTVLNPVLEAYFMTNALLSNEYNEVMIGGVYAHSKDTESGRLIAQIKRSVIFGATMHSYAQGLENGVADEVKIACMPDLQAYVQNIVGTQQTNDSMDGSGLCTMLQARLESNSLLDARVGYDKKSIGHDIDSKYGRPSLLKWAVYAMTNARRRIAFKSAVSQEVLCKKAYSAEKIDPITPEEMNEILAKIGPVYYKDTENTGRYYKIVGFRINPDTGMFERGKQEVDIHGNVIGNPKRETMPISNYLWDIDQMFGGAWAMTLDNGTLQYSESNVDALEIYVIKHQDAKTKQIGYLVNKSAMKVGVGNLNTTESWTDGSKLNTISMRTRYIGVQMDAEHHLDENEVTEMTQMISALAENGYTADLVDSIYTDIGNVIVEALKEYNAVLDENNPEKIYKLLGEIFIKSFENNDRDTLGLAQAFVLKASKALKEEGSTFRLPFSAETVSGLFISTVSSLMTKSGIRRKYEGFAGVLTPSFNMMQYYRVGNSTMMFEQFTDLIREKGITTFNDTGIKLDVPTTKIISGGQTGVDTIGLEVGRELGLQTGGTTTPGFIRESGIDGYDANSLQSLFGLEEISAELQAGKSGREFYLPRTEQNVINSDATVYFCSDLNSAGRIATERYAKKHNKKFIVNPTAVELRQWLIDNDIKTLNVAGNRGSKLGENNVASILRSALDNSPIHKAINNILVNNKLNPFLQPMSVGNVDFEDTVVVFDDATDVTPVDNIRTIIDGNGVEHNVDVRSAKTYYLTSFNEYDEFKHMNFAGKTVMNWTSRPKNLKATNTKFKVDGVQKSVYELDSVRAMFYYNQNRRPEFIEAFLESRGKKVQSSDKMFDVLQKLVQEDLRNFKHGKEIVKLIELGDNVFEKTTWVATDVQVTPAELITGRYHAKEFMMDAHENISDILEKGSDFFYQKLRTKYNFTDDEPVWKDANDVPTIPAETVLFTESGERYLVRTITGDKTLFVNRNGLVKDNSIEKINGHYYSGDNKIISEEGVDFYKYQDESGKIWNVILIESEDVKNDLIHSSYFEFYRHNYEKDDDIATEHENFDKRIRRIANRMYQSFLKQRQMLGTRIPTQAMQSFMPMEIVGYTDSLVNDVYVPVQQFFLQGSDLDIDKVYLLGFGINKAGKLQVNTKLADTTDYSYEELMQLVPPNGIKYNLVLEQDEDTFVISEEMLQNTNPIDLINEVMLSGKTKIFSNSKSINKFIRELNTHSRTTLSDKNIDAAIKNQVANNILNVASDVENQVIAQISVDAATKDLKDIAETSHLAEYEKTITSDNPLTMFVMQVQNMVGREVIGVTAVSLKQFFAKTAFYNKKIKEFIAKIQSDPNNVDFYVTELVDLVRKWNPLTQRWTVFANLNFLDAKDYLPNMPINFKWSEKATFTSLHELLNYLQNKANKNDAALTTSGILTLATDNAKELKLSKLNATASLVDIYTYLVSLGTDTQTIAKVMMSGSFSYIAKLVEGDIFNSFTRKVSLESAIKFYLGQYNLGIDEGVLAGLFDNYETDLFDNKKVEEAIKKCVEAIAANKEAEKELRRYQRELAEAGIEEEQYEEGDYQQYDPSLDENNNEGVPPVDLKSLSVPEICTIMAFLNECIDRNENRDTYMKDAATKEVTEKNLNLILTKVLPGVKEQGMLGKLAGINQGLKTKVFDKITFEQNINNYITDCVKSHIQSKIKELKIEKNRVKNDAAKLAKVIEQISNLQTQLENIVPFDFYTFVQDQIYQDQWIDKMKEIKQTDNILEIIVTVPHFKEMLKTWAVDETLLRKASVRYNFEKHLIKEIKPHSTYRVKDLEYNQVKQYVNDTLILNWMFSRGFTINIDQDQIDKYNIKTYDATGTLTNISSNSLRLDSMLAIDSFKHLMETWIVPELKQRFGDNAFLKALTLTSDNLKSGIKTYLKLPISMMDIDKSVEMETKYNQYVNAFDDISTQTFAGMKIADLFYLYNLIVNKDSFGQKSLTRLFENLVNSNKGSFLVNDYNEWISQLDASGDFRSLQMDLNDLRYRITEYVPETKVEKPESKRGLTKGLNTPDSCFDVPYLSDTPEAIAERELKEWAIKTSQTGIPFMNVLEHMDVAENHNGYNSRLGSGSDVVFVTKEDWGTDDNEISFNEPYFVENATFLSKQKSFIYNGKLYINVHNAGIGDLIHEWAHVMLAKMKWSDDSTERTKYYKMVAKVVDHPKFDDIAKHYPWAHGSDLQEEVLTNLFQMYIQNKVFKNDNIVNELVSMSRDKDDREVFDKYSEIIKFVENIFKVSIGDDVSLKNAKIKDLAQLFDEDFYNKHISGDNGYILRKHQKISAMKNQMIEEDLLKMVCN